MFTSAANVYGKDFQLDGWPRFAFGQSWGDAQEALKKLCSGAHNEGKVIHFAEDCGTWLGLKVFAANIRSVKKSFFSRRTLEGFHMEIGFSEKAENTILSLLRRNVQEMPERYRCDSYEITMDNKPHINSYCKRYFDNGYVRYWGKRYDDRHFIRVGFYSTLYWEYYGD